MSVNPLILLAVLLFFVLVLGFTLLRRKKITAKKQLEFLIKEHKQAEEKHIIIPDGVGGLLDVEHVVFLEQGVLLIETYEMDGNLFAAEHIDQWTQLINGRSFKFDNPLNRIYTTKQALMTLMPKVPIYCRIVFNGDVSFPKGKPDEVLVLNSIDNNMASILAQPSIAKMLSPIWERCMRIARKQ